MSTETECLRIISNQNNHYKILGVSRASTVNEIKQQYKKLVHMFHPDKNKSSSAEEAFKIINNAYDVLSNDNKREKYNKEQDEMNYYKETQRNSNNVHKKKSKTKSSTSSKNYNNNSFQNDFFTFYYQFSNQQKQSNFYRKKYYSTRYSETNQNEEQKKTKNKQKENEGKYYHSYSDHNSSAYNYYSKKRSGESPWKTVVFFHFAFIIIVLIVVAINKIISTFSSKNNVSFIQNQKYPIKRLTTKNSIPFYVNSNFDKNYLKYKEVTERKIESNYLRYIERKCLKSLNYVNNLEMHKKIYKNNQKIIAQIDSKIKNVDLSISYQYDELKLKIK